LHGLGGRPEPFDGGWQEYADELNIALIGASGTKAIGPRAFAWAEDLEKDAKRLRNALAEASDRVTVKKGHVITFGFSQGAQVGLEVAVRYPEEYAGSIVLSPGMLALRGKPHLIDLQPSPLLAQRGFVLSCNAEEHPRTVRMTASNAAWLRRAKAHVIHRVCPGVSTHSFPEDFKERFPEWVKAILKTRGE
jgi:predicted esterase